MKTDTGVNEELLSTPSSEKQNVDMAEITGGDGFWQWRIFLFVFFFQVPCSFHVFSMSFLAPNTDYWCARSPEDKNLSIEIWRNIAIPQEDHCSRYKFIDFNIPLQNSTNITEKATIPCEAWEYDTTIYHSTVLSQFNLVCGRKWLVSLSKSVFNAGTAVSLIVSGHLSDRFGRKPITIISGIITIISAIISAFSPTFTIFLIARFFIAVGILAFITTTFVLLMEVVAPKYRDIYGMASQLGWTLGFIVLPLIAWLIRDSFWIQLAITSPCLLILAVGWIPESPRWLLNQGKENKAKEILLSAAKINGVKHSDEQKEALKVLMTKGTEAYKSGGSKGNALDLWKAPGLWQITLNVYFNWFTIGCFLYKMEEMPPLMYIQGYLKLFQSTAFYERFVTAFVYYGLSINTNEMAGDPFLNFALSGIVEVPGNLFVIALFAVGFIGKKKILIVTMITTGVACVTSYLLPPNPWWLSVITIMIGKFSISISFSLIYIFSSELFPTAVRNIALGCASLSGRLGSIIAPFMRELGDATHPIFPQIIFGVLSIASGLLVFLLPDTEKISIPDTMEEAVQFSRKKECTKKEIKGHSIRVTMTEGQTNNDQDSTNLLVFKTNITV